MAICTIWQILRWHVDLWALWYILCNTWVSWLSKLTLRLCASRYAMSTFWKLRHSNVDYSAVSFHMHGRNHWQHMYQGIIKTYTAILCYSACAEYVSEVTSPTQGTLSQLYIMYWTSGELIASTVRCWEDPICIYSQCTLVSSRFHNGIHHTTFALVLLEGTKDSSFCCVGNVVFICKINWILSLVIKWNTVRPICTCTLGGNERID